MSKVQKISVALTDDLAAELNAAVASGDFATTSEAVRDAVRHWRDDRAQRSAGLEALRTAWRAGVESGSGRPLGKAELLAIKRPAKG